MHSLIVRLLVVLGIVALGACSPLLGPLEPSSPPPQPAPAAAYVPPPVVSSLSSQDEVRERAHHKRAVKHTSHTSAPCTSVANLAPENSGDDPNPDSRPSLTLVGEDDSRASAEQLLNRVDQRLALIDRTRLKGSDAATFDQAHGFASSAHQALADHDYVVASGLAEKASALTGRLSVSKPTH
jgi:hypothetical protein